MARKRPLGTWSYREARGITVDGGSEMGKVGAYQQMRQLFTKLGGQGAGQRRIRAIRVTFSPRKDLRSPYCWIDTSDKVTWISYESENRIYEQTFDPPVEIFVTKKRSIVLKHPEAEFVLASTTALPGDHSERWSTAISILLDPNCIRSSLS